LQWEPKDTTKKDRQTGKNDINTGCCNSGKINISIKNIEYIKLCKFENILYIKINSYVHHITSSRKKRKPGETFDISPN
jgi:hypothetical protein